MKVPDAEVDDEGDNHLIERIRALWVEEDLSSAEVCSRLAISVREFARIINTYNISKLVKEY